MKKIVFTINTTILLMAVVCINAAFAQSAPDHQSNYAYQREYHGRVDSIISSYSDNPAWGYFEAAARFYKGTDIDRAIAIMDSLTHKQEVDPSGDMFWMWPVIFATFTGQHYYPAKLEHRMRALWKNYHPYRGDTENHWLQYYTSMYLITQMYPDQPASSWFNGRSSEENHKEAEDYINSWIELTTKKGQGEFDSPTYYLVYVAPLCNLYAFTTDPVMKQKSKMLLDYFLADFAIDNLNGIYAGAHSRIYPRFIADQWNSNSTGIAWLAFGNTSSPRQIEQKGAGYIKVTSEHDTHRLYNDAALMMAMSGYHPPQIIRDIAVDRSKPYVSYELKRTRHRIRFSRIMDKPVYKYIYMSQDYAIGSIQGGLLQPIQQETWEINWSLPHPQHGNYSIHTIQQHSSGMELGMYFPEEPKLLTASVVKSKGNYDNPKKWIGGSPYEQVYQQKDALIALYNVKKGARYSTVDTQFPKTLSKREVDKSRWIFAQGGNAYIAFYPLAKYKWMEEETDYRLRSTQLKNGAVVQVASASDYSSFEAFKDAVKALPLKTSTRPVPRVDFTSLRGDHIVFEYDKTPELNGKPVDYSKWKLFESPYLYAEPNSEKMLMKYGNHRRLLDFKKLEIKDWTE